MRINYIPHFCYALWAFSHSQQLDMDLFKIHENKTNVASAGMSG